FLGSGPTLRNLQAEVSDSGRQVIEEPDVHHEFLFPRGSARGVAYRWTRSGLGRDVEPALQGEASSLVRGAEAVTVDVGYPVRQLELTVQLDPGSPPPAVAAFVAPDMSVP